LRAFSIGYKILDSEFLEEETSDGRDYANIIKDLKLFEVSVVSVPMNPYSLMKSMQDCFELKEVAEEEKEVVAESAKTTEDQEEKSADEDKEAESDKDEEEKEKKADTDEESDEEEEQDPPADEDDSEDDEDKKSLASEGKKADENSDIEEPEKSAQPENGAETAPESKKALGTAEGLKDLQVKSVENFISSEMKSIEKKFLDQLAEKDEKI
jgi:Caudovirus prohead protease.